MDFSSRSFADVVIATPAGQIDHANAQTLQQALAPILNQPPASTRALILDFSRVEYISSMGLRVLMMAAKQMRAKSSRIGVAGLRPVVKEIFDIARFSNVTEVFPSVRSALEQLSPTALAAYDANLQ